MEEVKTKAIYKTISKEEQAFESAYIEWLEKENKELREALQAFIIGIEPTIKSYGSYKKCHPLYEEWKDAKEVLEKYAKE